MRAKVLSLLLKTYGGHHHNRPIYECAEVWISLGNITTDTVQIWKAWKYADAPHHYYESGDGKTDRITNPDGSTSYGIEAHVSNANFFSVPDDATLALQIQEGSVADPEYVSNRQYVFDLNEERSRIRVIDPNHIGKFNDAFRALIKN